jgi:hypothetical protein
VRRNRCSSKAHSGIKMVALDIIMVWSESGSRLVPAFFRTIFPFPSHDSPKVAPTPADLYFLLLLFYSSLFIIYQASVNAIFSAFEDINFPICSYNFRFLSVRSKGVPR